MLQFVLYILVNPTTDPKECFYIGVGKAGRPAQHQAIVTSGIGKEVNFFKNAVIREILSQGMEVEYHVLYWFATIVEAFDAEIIAIATCRAAFLPHIKLCNIHRGGRFSPTKYASRRRNRRKRELPRP